MQKPSLHHLAIIMDGNGRWASAQGMARIEGHKKGMETARQIVIHAHNCGVKVLTLYGFSSENWKRPQEEVEALMELMRSLAGKKLKELDKLGIAIHIIGSRKALAPDIIELIEKVERHTAKNNTMHLLVAFNYGGRAEMIHAMQLMGEKIREGTLAPQEINEESFSRHIFTAGFPDPDLIIRTGGETRLSNFLSWQSVYAELIFVDTLWPDFTPMHLDKAMQQYKKRERRYGGVEMQEKQRKEGK